MVQLTNPCDLQQCSFSKTSIDLLRNCELCSYVINHPQLLLDFLNSFHIGNVLEICLLLAALQRFKVSQNAVHLL